MKRSLPLRALALLHALAAAAWAGDLPSWNEGPARDAILEFVRSVTEEGSPGFVPEERRITVFDNDGTLWAEQPMYAQLRFAVDRVRALAPERPEWREREPFRSILRGDLQAAFAGGERAILEIVAETHSGMTTDEFEAVVREWIATARHPETGRLYTEMVYQPMVELLAHLRERGFETYIVSGGGVEFMRPWAEAAYGVPPERVIGSSAVASFEMRDGVPVIVKQREVGSLNDGPGKPLNIHLRIGRRPIAAFGNSDGDLQMLQWTDAAPGAGLCVLVHHTDAAREWAYDRASHVGRLDKALDEARARGWVVIDMARDWRTIFPEPSGPAR